MKHKQKHLHLAKCIVTFALAICMVLGSIPVLPGVIKVKADEYPRISSPELGIGKILNPKAPTSSDDPWTGSYVYYGKYSNSENGTPLPIKFRVLQNDTTDFSKETEEGKAHTMFLDCDSILGKDWLGNSFYWTDTDIKKWLNNSGGFIDKSFTTAENRGIAESYVSLHERHIEGVAELQQIFVNEVLNPYVALEGEKIFFLDVEDVLNPLYGYYTDDGNDKIKNCITELGGEATSWWLRSESQYSHYFGAITDKGETTNRLSRYPNSLGISPALNLKLSSIVFSCLIQEEENSPEAGQYGAEYKLTVVDSGMGIQLNDIPTICDNVLSIPYKIIIDSSLTSSHPDDVSLVVTDGTWTKNGWSEGANIIYYPATVEITSTDEEITGTASFTLESSFIEALQGTNGYHIYILAEDVNGAYETDYATEPVEILLDEISWESTAVSAIWVENGTSDKATAEDGETVTIYANEPEAGQIFVGWTSDSNYVTFADPTASTTTFTMPDCSVTVTANYEDDPSYGSAQYCGAEGDGSNATWSINGSTLTISGTGAMADYDEDENPAPWRSKQNIIKNIAISDGITRIGNFAFCYLTNVKSVTIPGSVTTIGDSAFHNCSIESLVIEEGVEKIEDQAFDMAFTGKENVIIPKSVKSIGYVAFGGLSDIYICGDNIELDEWSFSVNEAVYLPATAACDALEENAKEDEFNIKYICMVPNPEKDTFAYTGSEITAFEPKANCGYTVSGNKATNIDNYTATCTLNAQKVLGQRGEGGDITATYVWGDLSNPDSWATATDTEPKVISWSIVDSNENPSGSCGAEGDGSNATWNLTGDTLTISGTGAMADYDPDDDNYAPWHAYRDYIKKIVISNGITSIGEYAFYMYYSLENVTIFNTVTTIGDYAFYDCASLSEVTFGSGIEKIGECAFYYCSSLTSVTLPESLKSIGDYAFANISSLTDVNIGRASINAVWAYVFEECQSFSTVLVDDANTAYTAVDGVLFSKNTKKLVYYPAGKTEETYTIPSTVTEIDDYAFYNNHLKSITIPGNVQTIGDSAFETANNGSIESLVIEEGVQDIGDSAFFYAFGENVDVIIPESVESIGDNAFVNARDIYICGDDIELDEHSFVINGEIYALATAACEELEENASDDGFDINYICQVPETTSFTYTGNEITAFKQTANCGYTVSGNKGTEIDSYKATFVLNPPKPLGQSGMTAKYVWGDVSSPVTWKDASDTDDKNINWSIVGSEPDAFGYCGAEGDGSNVTWTISGSTLTISGSGAMADYEVDYSTYVSTAPWESRSGEITDIIIEDGITRIGDWAFYCFWEVGAVNIPESVTTIGDSAFFDCEALSSVTFGSKIEEIGEEAFGYCAFTGLLTLPESLKKIGDYAFGGNAGLTSVEIGNASADAIWGKVFSGCESLESVSVASTNTAYTVENGVLFNKDKTRLLWYPAGKTDTTYTIPATVTEIADYAFYSSKFGTITIPGNVKRIGDYAFYQSSLQSFTIEEGVEEIGAYAFIGSLSTIVIPKSVEYIGEHGFASGGGGIDGDVYICGDQTVIEKDAFSCMLSGKVYAPAAVECDYLDKNSEFWGFEIVYICTAPDPEKDTFAWTGSEITFFEPVANCGYSVIGNKATEAGSYTAICTLNDSTIELVNGWDVVERIKYVWGDITKPDTWAASASGEIEYQKTFDWSIGEQIEPIMVLESIAISTAPTKTVYTEGEKFDATGMVVTATYSDEGSSTVTEYTWTPNGNLTTSDTSITVSYTDGDVTKTATQAITVNPATPILESIVISTAPNKTVYTEGEKFDATGMVVTATYSNGTSSAVTGYTWTPNGNLTTNNNMITVSYTEGKVTKTATQSITVQAITVNPVTYTVRVTNDGNGNASASVASGTSGTAVTLMAKPSEGFIFKEWQVVAGGVTVTNNKFAIGTANVEIKAVFEKESEPEKVTPVLTSIAISTDPSKLVYTEGEKFDATGMVITATYSDNTSSVVTGYTWTPNGNLTTSNKTITVIYTKDGVTKSAKLTITVNAKSSNNGQNNGSNSGQQSNNQNSGQQSNNQNSGQQSSNQNSGQQNSSSDTSNNGTTNTGKDKDDKNNNDIQNKPSGTPEQDSAVTKNPDGTTTKTEEKVAEDGSKVKTETTTDSNGELVEKVTETTSKDGKGRVTVSTVTEKSDGAKEVKNVTKNSKDKVIETVTKKISTDEDDNVIENSITEKSNGTTIESNSTTTSLGEVTFESIETRKTGTVITQNISEMADGSSNSTKVTTKKDGSSTAVTTDKKATGSSKTVTVKKDASGKVISYKKTTVSKNGKKSYVYYTVKKQPEGDGKKAASGTVKVKNSKITSVTVKIPNKVTIDGKKYIVNSIAASAFANNEYITSVSIGSNVTYIGKHAFANAVNLKYIYIGSGKITKIGEGAFENIPEDAVIIIKAGEEDFNRIVNLLHASGLSTNVTIERED